jgi:hypothetical protein
MRCVFHELPDRRVKRAIGRGLCRSRHQFGPGQGRILLLCYRNQKRFQRRTKHDLLLALPLNTSHLGEKQSLTFSILKIKKISLTNNEVH